MCSRGRLDSTSICTWTQSSLVWLSYKREWQLIHSWSSVSGGQGYRTQCGFLRPVWICKLRRGRVHGVHVCDGADDGSDVGVGEDGAGCDAGGSEWDFDVEGVTDGTAVVLGFASTSSTDLGWINMPRLSEVVDKGKSEGGLPTSWLVWKRI